MNRNPREEVFCIQVSEVAEHWGNVIDPEDPEAGEAHFWSLSKAEQDRLIAAALKILLVTTGKNAWKRRFSKCATPSRLSAMTKEWIRTDETSCYAARCWKTTRTKCDTCWKPFCPEHHALHQTEACGFCQVDACECDFASEIVDNGLEVCTGCAAAYRLGQSGLAIRLLDQHSESLSDQVKRALNALVVVRPPETHS